MDREQTSLAPPESGERGSVPVTISLPESLSVSLSEKAEALGLSREEFLVRTLSDEFSSSEAVLGPVRADIGRLSEKSDLHLQRVREEIRDIDDRNRRAYDALALSLKPTRKEWGILIGGVVLVALLLPFLLFGLGGGPPEKASVINGQGKNGASLPSQLGEKDKYVYFVGRWYLGVRDRMSTKERLFLENYLKPFDNFDEDLKARKAAGL